jgi:hypothetical protein
MYCWVEFLGWMGASRSRFREKEERWRLQMQDIGRIGTTLSLWRGKEDIEHPFSQFRHHIPV